VKRGMITALTVGAALAGAVGLVQTVRSGQWRNAATAAYAASAICAGLALYSTNSALEQAEIIGPGVPRDCVVANGKILPTLILSCPVPVKAPPPLVQPGE
jgi:hypothetical protein